MGEGRRGRGPTTDRGPTNHEAAGPGGVTVRVEFYGRLKRAAGLEAREVELDQERATVADLLARLRSRELADADALESVVVAVGDQVARPDRVLRKGEVVGLLPPVSGG